MKLLNIKIPDIMFVVPTLVKEAYEKSASASQWGQGGKISLSRMEVGTYERREILNRDKTRWTPAFYTQAILTEKSA